MILNNIRLSKTVAALDSPESEMSVMFQKFTPLNILEYASEPRTTIGGTYENLDKPARYRPQVQFSINGMRFNEYADKFYDIINTRSFFIEYDDVFGRVRRNVRLGDHEREFIIQSRNRVELVANMQFTFISRYGYRMTDASGADIGMDFLKMNLLTDIQGRF